ncbi:MAG: DUF6516 family protein [Rhodocyclaceae bacterium]|nr:DUF6516 family protein [Rhodocyclaceae bacterium]
MNATLIAQAKEIRDNGSIVEVVVWELAEPLPPCTHLYKYRLFFGLPGECFVRYGNERGKGDHRHWMASSPTTPSSRWTNCWPIPSVT